MATICPIDGCKQTQGLCLHDKVMLMMGGLLASLAGAHWGLHLF